MTLDGSGSTDPDDDELTYTWAGPFGTAEGATPTVTLPLGASTVTLTVDDGNGETATDNVVVTVQDTTAPSTSAILDGVMGNNGWYVSAVDVALRSTDSCTGVKEVHYRLDGDEHVVAGSAADFTVAGDGTHTVAYFAVDNAGNTGSAATEAVMTETAPPATTATPSEAPGEGGYYTSCVMVDLRASSGGSGTAGTEYSLDGGLTWQPYTGAFEVCGDGETTVSYRSTSNAGNVEETKTLVIMIDQTPPVITISGVEDGAAYALGLVPEAGYDATDATSGLASSGDSLTGGDGMGLGTFTYTVSAEDNAGNATSLNATYEVIATEEGAAALIGDMAASGEIAAELENSLLSQLANADLQALINHIEAQAGKKITEEAAEVLINAIEYLMGH